MHSAFWVILLILLPSGPSLYLCSGPCCFPGRLFLAYPSTSSSSPVQSILHIITLETLSKTNLYSIVFQVCLHIVATLLVLAENPSFLLWHSGNNLTTNNFSNISQQCSNAQSLLHGCWTTMWTKIFLSCLCGFAYFIPTAFLLNSSANKLLFSHQSPAQITPPPLPTFQGGIARDLESPPQFSKTYWHFLIIQIQEDWFTSVTLMAFTQIWLFKNL